MRPLIAACSVILCAPAAAMVGGAPAANDRIASAIVMVSGSRGNFCTGTLVARDLVLTAAHCVAPVATYIVIPKQGAAPIASRVLVHPGYNPQSFAANRATADVALLKLASPLPDSSALLANAASIAVGDRLTIAGFGVTAAGSDAGIGVARMTSLTVTGQPGNLQVRLFDPATKGDRPGLGACTGDSGGPAFRDIGGRLTVVGVLSWSTGPKLSAGCGGLTGVTPLVRYRDWITQTAAKIGSPLAP